MSGARFKVEHGLLATGATSNSVFEHKVDINANLSVMADLLYVGGNLYVSGDQVISGNTVYDTNIIPASSNVYLGNTTNRFNAYLSNVSINGELLPSSNNIPLGNTTNRWYVYSSTLDVANAATFSGNTSFIANVGITGTLVLSNTASLGNTTITGFANVTGNTVVGNQLTVNGVTQLLGNVSCNTNFTSKNLGLEYATMFSNTATVTAPANNNIVDSYPKTSSYTSKLLVSVNNANVQLHTIEMLLVHDGTTALISTYGELFNTSLGTFDAGINGANVEIYFSPTSANTYFVRTVRHNIL